MSGLRFLTGNDNNFSLGASGSYSGGLTPLPTTKNESRTSNTSSTGSKATVESSISNYLENTIFNKRNMTPEAMAALQQLIGSGGSNPLLDAQDQGKQDQMVLLNQMLGMLDPSKAAEMASGRTADLSRQLREQVLPELFGGAEAAGFGGDALTSLLAQDASIRTGEAQSRVEEEVRSNVQEQALQASEILNQLLDSGSGTMDALLQALNISKGAVEQGSESKTGTSSTRGTTTEVSQDNTNENANISSSLLDPVEWAKIQAQLQIAGMNQPTGPSEQEKLLAAFNASKGPFMSFSNYGDGGPEDDLFRNLSKLGF